MNLSDVFNFNTIATWDDPLLNWNNVNFAYNCLYAYNRDPYKPKYHKIKGLSQIKTMH